MTIIKCFWLEPTDQIKLGLRRFRNDQSHPCSLSETGCHQAFAYIGHDHQDNHTLYYGDSWDHNDSRWPTHCDCGYAFKSTDAYQFNPIPLFKRSDTHELVTAQEAPYGAMRHCDWLKNMEGYQVGVDGILLSVKTPGGWWCIDGPSFRNGVITRSEWQRTGIVPNISVTPSILQSTYHGQLTNGYLQPIV